MIKVILSSFLILSSVSIVSPVATTASTFASIDPPKTRVLSSREMLSTEIDNKTVNETQEEKLRVVTWDIFLEDKKKIVKK